MDAMEFVLNQFDEAIKSLRLDLRESKRQLMSRLDSQDRILSELVKVKTVEQQAHKPVGKLAMVLISWGQQPWFPYLAAFLIATAGGKAIKEWGTLILQLLTPKP